MIVKDRCVYVFEFPDNYVYVGLTYDFNKRKKEHLNRRKSPVFKHIKMSGNLPNKIYNTEYINQDDAKKLEIDTLDLYIKSGWNKLNKVKPGCLGHIGSGIIWTDELIRLKSIECKTKHEFEKKYKGAYGAAHRLKIIDELYPNPIRKKSGYWNYENVKNESLKYKSRNEFKKQCKVAYMKALDLKIIEELFPNIMRVNNGYWTYETIKNISSKYEKSSDFKKNEPSLYRYSCKLKILNKLFPNIKSNINV